MSFVTAVLSTAHFRDLSNHPNEREKRHDQCARFGFWHFFLNFQVIVVSMAAANSSPDAHRACRMLRFAGPEFDLITIVQITDEGQVRKLALG